MIAAFVRYDEAGAVTDWGAMADDVIQKLQDEGQRIAFGGTGHSPDFYVDLDTGVARPNQDNPAVLDSMTLRGVPVPSKLRIGTVTYDIDEPEIELSFPLPGTYALTLTSVRYLTKTFSVTA
jgi:hypothetical protein